MMRILEFVVVGLCGFTAGTIYGSSITHKMVGDAHAVLLRAKELHESSKQMLEKIVSRL